MVKFSNFRKRGLTAVETLVSLVVGAFVALVVFQQFVSLLAGVKANSDMGGTSADVRRALDTMSDHVRNAQLCTTSGNTYLNSVLSTSTSAYFTYFTDNTCGKYVKYEYTNSGGVGILRRSEDGGTTYTTVVSGITSFSLTYYKAAYYNTAWTAMSSPPTTADLPNVCGIRMDMTITSNATATRISTLVRMRNAPKKVGLDGIS